MPLTHSPDYVEAMTSPNQPRPRLSQNPHMAAAERERLEIYDEIWRDLEMRGFKAASVIRLSPWTLTLDGPCHQAKTLPGVPIDPEMWAKHQPRIKFASGVSIPYVHHVISAPYITVGPRFRGRSESDSTVEMGRNVDLPIGLARDMANQQNQYRSQGGIFCYEGADLPQRADGAWVSEDRAWLTISESHPLAYAAEQAFERMLTHMKAVMDQATMAHVSQEKELMRELRGNRFRQAVQYLLNVGVISTPPQWFQERGDGSTKARAVQCPMCPKKVELGTKKCTCGYILDPYGAYGHLYTEESEGGLMTARRMTREQLETLSLYPRIKPLAEYLADKSADADEPERKGKGKGKTE